MFCRNCGKQLPDGVKFCTACGTAVVTAAPKAAPAAEPAPATEPVPAPAAEPTAAETTAASAAAEKTPAAPKKPVNKKLIAILAAVAVAIAAIAAVVVLVVLPAIENANTYNEATALLEAKQYGEAQELFESLGDYKDSSDIAYELNEKANAYKDLTDSLAAKDYDNAMAILAGLEGYADCDEIKADLEDKAAKYTNALALIDSGSYDDAAAILTELGDYSDSAAVLSRLNAYTAAHALLTEGSFDDAIDAFLALGDYLDSADMAAFEVPYQKALALLDAKNFEDAKTLFEDLGDYLDSADMAAYEVPYREALYKLAYADQWKDWYGYEQAYALFSALGDYSDSAEKMAEALKGAVDSSWNLGAWGRIRGYVTLMDDEAFADFLANYEVGDPVWADTLTACLQAISESEKETEEYALLLEKLTEQLESCAGMFFIDTDLQELVSDFCEALTREYANIDETGAMVNWRNVYQARISQAEALASLHETYEYLEETDPLYIEWIRMAADCQTVTEIIDEMAAQLREFEIYNDDTYGWYTAFTNTTSYDFMVTYHFEYTLGSEVVRVGEELTAEAHPGDEVILLLVDVADETLDRDYATLYYEVRLIEAEEPEDSTTEVPETQEPEENTQQ